MNTANYTPRPRVVTHMLAALEEALEFVEGQEDVKDGPDGEQVPNEAMRVAQTLRAAIALATGSTS